MSDKPLDETRRRQFLKGALAAGATAAIGLTGTGFLREANAETVTDTLSQIVFVTKFEVLEQPNKRNQQADKTLKRYLDLASRNFRAYDPEHVISYTCVSRTLERAKDELVNFCRVFWKYHRLPGNPPDNEEELVTRYFDSAEHHTSTSDIAARSEIYEEDLDHTWVTGDPGPMVGGLYGTGLWWLSNWERPSDHSSAIFLDQKSRDRISATFRSTAT